MSRTGQRDCPVRKTGSFTDSLGRNIYTSRCDQTQVVQLFDSQYFSFMSSWVASSRKSVHSAGPDSTQLNQTTFSRDPVFKRITLLL